MVNVKTLKFFGDKEGCKKLLRMVYGMLDRVQLEMSWNNLPQLRRRYAIPPNIHAPHGGYVQIDCIYGVNNVEVYVVPAMPVPIPPDEEPTVVWRDPFWYLGKFYTYSNAFVSKQTKATNKPFGSPLLHVDTHRLGPAHGMAAYGETVFWLFRDWDTDYARLRCAKALPLDSMDQPEIAWEVPLNSMGERHSSGGPNNGPFYQWTTFYSGAMAASSKHVFVSRCPMSHHGFTYLYGLYYFPICGNMPTRIDVYDHDGKYVTTINTGIEHWVNYLDDERYVGAAWMGVVDEKLFVVWLQRSGSPNITGINLWGHPYRMFLRCYCAITLEFLWGKNSPELMLLSGSSPPWTWHLNALPFTAGCGVYDSNRPESDPGNSLVVFNGKVYTSTGNLLGELQDDTSYPAFSQDWIWEPATMWRPAPHYGYWPPETHAGFCQVAIGNRSLIMLAINSFNDPENIYLMTPIMFPAVYTYSLSGSFGLQLRNMDSQYEVSAPPGWWGLQLEKAEVSHLQLAYRYPQGN